MGTKHTRTFKLVTCCFTWDLLDVLVVAYVHTHADTHTHVNREKGWLLSSLSGALFSVSFSSFTSEKWRKSMKGRRLLDKWLIVYLGHGKILVRRDWCYGYQCVVDVDGEGGIQWIGIRTTLKFGCHWRRRRHGFGWKRRHRTVGSSDTTSGGIWVVVAHRQVG